MSKKSEGDSNKDIKGDTRTHTHTHTYTHTHTHTDTLTLTHMYIHIVGKMKKVLSSAPVRAAFI